MDMESIFKDIKNMLNEYTIVLFIKGNPEKSVCGFSASVVEILNKFSVPYHHVDVLLNNKMRQGIKEFSNWPTIPQLYVAGEFIGGCDIIEEMYEEGNLQQLLENTLVPSKED